MGLIKETEQATNGAEQAELEYMLGLNDRTITLTADDEYLQLVLEKKIDTYLKKLDEERESIIILAPADVSARILEDVNEKYGLRSEARGILCAVPVEKAYKI